MCAGGGGGGAFLVHSQKTKARARHIASNLLLSCFGKPRATIYETPYTKADMREIFTTRNSVRPLTSAAHPAPIPINITQHSWNVRHDAKRGRDLPSPSKWGRLFHPDSTFPPHRGRRHACQAVRRFGRRPRRDMKPERRRGAPAGMSATLRSLVSRRSA